MKDKFLKEMNNEFKEFLSDSTFAASSQSINSVLTTIKNELQPNPWIVFIKLSGIHFFCALFTLAACPQFDIQLFGNSMGLMHYFSKLGTYGCIAACGAFFVSFTFILSGLILKLNEIKTIRMKGYLQINAISLISLAAFRIAGAEILLTLAFAWIIGSVLASISIYELLYHLRYKLNLTSN